MSRYNEFVDSLQEEWIRLRRHFHTYPELSAKEVETSKYLKKYVNDLGLEICDVEGTGFYAVLDTNKPGKTIGLRCDIDALPMSETTHNLKRERECISAIDGVMHSCGHDAHMTIVLGVMRTLLQHQEDLKGKFVFIFEEGEEIATGIAAMIKALENIDFDVIYGNHVSAENKSGTFAIQEGPVMAGLEMLEVEVTGKGGHGARPDLAINPVFAASNILVNLASAWANQIDVSKTVTLGFTQIHGGTANNIISDTCTFGGTLRFFDVEEGLKGKQIVETTSELVGKAHRCTTKMRTLSSLKPVINDPKYTKIAIEATNEIFPNSVVEDYKWFASESFYRYSELCPTVFMFAGIQNDEFGSGADHHNIYFDVDEQAMIETIKQNVAVLIHTMNQ